MFARLRLSQKLFLVTALLAVPLLFVTITFVQQTKNLTLRSLELQRNALPVLEDMGRLGKLIRDRGAKLPLWILGVEISPLSENESVSAIRGVVAEIGKDFEKLDHSDRVYWSKLEKQVIRLTEGPDGKTASFADFADLSDTLATAINSLSYQFRFYSSSNRLISTNRLAFDICPAMAVSVNRLRGMITYQAVIHERSLLDIRRISEDLTLVKFRMKEIELASRDIQEQNAVMADQILPGVGELKEETQALERMIETYIATDEVNLDATAFFQASSRVLDSVDSLNKKTIDAISLDLTTSIDQSRAEIRFLVGLVAISSGLVACIVFFMARSLLRGVRKIEYLTERIAKGQRDLQFHLKDNSDEIESIVREIYKIYLAICGSEARARLDTWLLQSQKSINDRIRSESSLERFSGSCLRAISDVIGSDAATFYICEKEEARHLSSYGAGDSRNFRKGEGLVGAAVIDRRMRIYRSEEIPDYTPRIETSLGSSAPGELIIFPLSFQGEVVAVLEFLSFRRFADNAQAFLDAIEENTAVLLRNVMAKNLVDELLRKTQIQSDELRRSNVELEEKSDLLNSQQKLLKEANEELEEQRSELEAQNEKLEKVVESLAFAKKEAEEASREADKANRFKSIFLANISHELRTPLNSIMILSQILSENRDGNLNPVQTKNASTIYTSGRDLLNLINEILDLSKIEAGKLDIHTNVFPVKEVAAEIKAMHEPLAQRKDLRFDVAVDDDCPETINSDMARVTQIIRNFVANAIKFTEEGFVQLRFSRSRDRGFLLEVSVSDSGTGIPEDKQSLIFEPFKQLNNSLSRKHEGTGLGLSISQNLAKKLGGKIELQSEQGKGSTFILFLPLNPPGSAAENSTNETLQAEGQSIQANDLVILAMGIPREMTDGLRDRCKAEDFRCLIVQRQDQLNALAGKCSPRGIILDLNKDDPRSVSLLEDLKSNPRTRSIPLHIMRSWEHPTIEEALDDVALFLHSVDSRTKRHPEQLLLKEDIFNHKKILLVDDDIRNVYSLRQVLQAHGCETIVAVNGKEALDSLDQAPDVSLVLMDIMMPEMDGYEAMRRIRKIPRFKALPIIALTAKAMKSDREQCLEAGASDYLMKPIDNERLISLMRVWLSK